MWKDLLIGCESKWKGDITMAPGFLSKELRRIQRNHMVRREKMKEWNYFTVQFRRLFHIYLNLKIPQIPILMLCLKKSLKCVCQKHFTFGKESSLTEKQASSYSYCVVWCNLLDSSWLHFMIHIEVIAIFLSFYYKAKMLSHFSSYKIKQTSFIYSYYLVTITPSS